MNTDFPEKRTLPPIQPHALETYSALALAIAARMIGSMMA